MEDEITTNETQVVSGTVQDYLLIRAGILGRALRQLGAVLVVMSALAFMLQRWSVSDHITRYFSFLGFTAIVAASALFCALGIKESKGARTLLAIIAGIVPVHFAQLGALLFSLSATVLSAEKYPEYLRWTAPSPLAAYATIASGMIVLVPLLFFALAGLFRQHAKRLLVVSLLSNVILLIPTRDPGIVALIAGLALVVLMTNDFSMQRIVRFPTFENRFARGTIFLPVAVMIGRQMTLYTLSYGFRSMACLALTAFLFVQVPKYANSAVATFSRVASCIPLCVGWAYFVAEVMGDVPGYSLLALPLFGLPLSAALLYMSIYTPRQSTIFQILAALIAVGSSAIDLDQYPGMTASLFSLSCIVMLLVTAYIFERQLLLIVAALAGVHSLGFHVRMVFRSYDLNIWITLGIVGVATIVLASFLEKNFVRVTAIGSRSRKAVATWER